MKPIPDINNQDAMVKRGQMSALGSARNDATEELRDALSTVNSATWEQLHGEAVKARAAAERLLTLSAMWQEVTA